MTRVQFALATILCTALSACATAPSNAKGKSDILQRSDATLARAQQHDPQLAQAVRDSAGYAVFPNIGKAAAGIGGAYGKGVLYERGSMIGYCDMTQATVGLQLGGQSYSEIICFENKAALNRFKQGDFAFDAQASGAAMEAGSSANVDYAGGVEVFTMNEAGLMVEASVGGQRFTFVPAN